MIATANHRATGPADGRSVSGGWVGQVADLRRRRLADAADLILRRAEHLAAPDRELLRAVYADGVSISRLAALPGRGGGEREAGLAARALRRRVRALVSRVLSPAFAFVLANQESWTPVRRRIAEAVVLRGATMREASAQTNTSLHTVRRHVDAIRAMCDAAA